MKISPNAWHGIATLSFIGLFLLLMAWNTVLSSPSKLPKALTLLVSIGPLLLPMRGFLKGNIKNCAWMAYISMIYLIHGTAEAYAVAATRTQALGEVVLSLLLFFASVFYIRATKALDAGTTADTV